LLSGMFMLSAACWSTARTCEGRERALGPVCGAVADAAAASSGFAPPLRVLRPRPTASSFERTVEVGSMGFRCIDTKTHRYPPGLAAELLLVEVTIIAAPTGG